MVKVKCTFRVTLNHPYIGTKNANGPCEVRCHLRRSLVMAWTVVRTRHRVILRHILSCLT